MLRRLSIRNVVLIDALDLEFEPGLNILTGETGAGKSILLDALGFALGAKSGAGLVSAGADQGSASALFELSGGTRAAALLAEQGLAVDAFAAEGGEAILRRAVSADGRARAFVNDHPVSVAALRAIGETLVELHGQHDDRGLLNPAGHRATLDAFGGVAAELAACRAQRAAWRSASTALAEAERRLSGGDQDLDYLEHAASELAALAPVAFEEPALDAERRLMKQAEKIAEEVARAVAALGPGGAEGALGDALGRLQHVAAQADGMLDASLAALDRTLAEHAEALRELEAAADALTVEPSRLDAVEERLFALRAVARKHRCQVGELPAIAETISQRLQEAKGAASALDRLAEGVASARAAYQTAAETLHDARCAAAMRLDEAVASELPALKLERAAFRTEIARVALDEGGFDGITQVRFTVATNPGAEAGPLDKIASGGELARFLLAIKVALAERAQGRSHAVAPHEAASATAGTAVALKRADAPTLIFDEIDRGVGGATAEAVGARLWRLAHAGVTPPEIGAPGQAIAVTHSPQVAAAADRHWRIEKRLATTASGAESARTAVSQLDEAGRIEEIARMISGETITDAARAAAAALIAGAPGGAGDASLSPQPLAGK